MFLNNVDDNVVIKFDDPESSPQRLDQRRPSKKTSVIKIDNLHSMSTQFAKNENYIRNLGQNQARYEAEQEFNYDKMQVEKQTKPQIDAQPIQESNPGSIINFDDYIESQSQVRSINQIDDEASQSGSNYENEKINQSQSPKKIDLSKSSMTIADVSQVVSSYPQINKDIQFFQSQDFLLSPLSQAGMVQCKFMIDESGFNKFSVKFYLIKDGIIYLAAKKTSHKYIISTEKGKYDKKASSFIGQVSCKQKNQYFMWNSGNNPKKSTKNIRESLGTLNFILDKKPNQPRQQKFQFPRQDSEYMNRLPRWNDKTKSFTLNFYDRVKKASIKNFQMIKQDAQPEKIYVQFGKVSDHEFNLDFHTPFSPLQAFMIALANYDKKIEY